MISGPPCRTRVNTLLDSSFRYAPLNDKQRPFRFLLDPFSFARRSCILLIVVYRSVIRTGQDGLDGGIASMDRFEISLEPI